jgi:hypothetical protein
MTMTTRAPTSGSNRTDTPLFRGGVVCPISGVLKYLGGTQGEARRLTNLLLRIYLHVQTANKHGDSVHRL